MAEPLVLSAGYQLRDQAGALADAVVACEFSRNPRLRLRYGPGGRGKSRQDAAYHLAFLADAVDVDSQAVFNDYIAWAKVLLLHFGVLTEDLDQHLGCMADVVSEQMPAPVAASAVAMIEAARSALAAMPATAPPCLDPDQRLEPLAREYARALLGGYRQAAGQLVFDAADRGTSVRELYLQVFQPALREVGRLWQTRRISVAQEHFCSAATQVVPRAVGDEQPGRDGNAGAGGLELRDRAEAVPRAVDEHRRRAKGAEVRGPRFARLPRRVQRIGEEEQRVGQPWRLRRQHRGLAAAVGVAAQHETARRERAQRGAGVAEAGPVALAGAAMWGPGRPLLPEGQIAAQHRPPRSGQGLGHRDEDGRVRVASRAVGEEDPVTRGRRRPMQPAAHRGPGRARIGESRDGGHGTRSCSCRGSQAR